MSKKINVIAFDVPFPANYGGVIDVFYKLKALKNQGYGVILHCFQYGREAADELNELCDEVIYYPRKTGLLANLTFLPYIIQSRKNKTLLLNLLTNDYPILFEGIHSCIYLPHSRLRKRLKIVRSHNIEHHYYYELMKNASSIFLKSYFFLESFRLKIFYPNLKYADKILAISEGDRKLLCQTFDADKIQLVRAFHQNSEVTIKKGEGGYVLYHGNLDVSENSKVAEFIIDKIALRSSLPIIIAGLNPSKDLIKKIQQTHNVSLDANVDDEQMKALIQNAQVNLILTFQDTGLKLKMVNAIYNGRFIIANDLMLDGMNFGEGVLQVTPSASEILKTIDSLKKVNFSKDLIEERKRFVSQSFSDKIDWI